MEKNTERETEMRRREEKWQNCWCCRDQRRACKIARASAAKLEQTAPTEKERMALAPQSEQSARTPELLLPKKKKQSCMSRSPDGEVRESQGKR